MSAKPRVPVRERVSLVLPVKMPSGNSMKGRKWEQLNARKRYERQLIPLRDSARCEGPAILTITRILGPRERPYDTDRLYGAAGPLIDALGSMGYIPSQPRRKKGVIVRMVADDRPEMLDLRVHQDERMRASGPRILVSIRPRRTA